MTDHAAKGVLPSGSTLLYFHEKRPQERRIAVVFAIEKETLVYGASIFRRQSKSERFPKAGIRATAAARFVKCPVRITSLPPFSPGQFRWILNDAARVDREDGETFDDYRARRDKATDGLRRLLREAIRTKGVRESE